MGNLDYLYYFLIQHIWNNLIWDFWYTSKSNDILCVVVECQNLTLLRILDILNPSKTRYVEIYGPSDRLSYWNYKIEAHKKKEKWGPRLTEWSQCNEICFCIYFHFLFYYLAVVFNWCHLSQIYFFHLIFLD